MSQRPKVFSGIQPTGDMHMGNYIGAVANWVKLQESHQCVYSIVDLHSMTMPYRAETLRSNTQQMFIDLLACGVDPDKSILFIQSQVPEHAELCWILSCVCPYGDLRRMTQFKQKSEKGEKRGNDFVSAGLLCYPILQAADILMYHASAVPVGKDQEQHLELARVIARRFNEQFSVEFFAEPQPLLTEAPKIASLADPCKKMSKSDGERHYIGLFEDERGIREKIKAAVTDSGDAAPDDEVSPGVTNLLSILRALDKTSTVEAFKQDIKKGNRRYRDLKETVADALVELTARLRVKRMEIAEDLRAVSDLSDRMAEQARAIARETVREVRKLVGLPYRKG